MKYLTLFSTLLAVAAAAPLAEVAEVESIQDVQAVEAKDPGSSGEQGLKILKKFKDEPAAEGLSRVTKKIGTWTVTSAKMISTFKMVTETPCGIGGCYVTAMEATIRYPDKSEANVDTGAWLHHIAMFGSGTGTGGSLWACGNERPTLRLNSGELKYGIDWPNTYMMMIDLMTEVATPKSLTLEVTYEIIDKAPGLKAGYKAATMYWLTLGADRAAKDGIYSFSTQVSPVTSNGRLLYSIGHMHDAGTDMQLFVENSMAEARKTKSLIDAGGIKTITARTNCKSVMFYPNSPEIAGTPMAGMDMKASGSTGHAHGGHSRRDGHGGHGAPGSHIVAPGACIDFGDIKVGQYLVAGAQYDAVNHVLMEHNGEKEKLMGNMRVYVGPT
jgi:hypothetical protein